MRVCLIDLSSIHRAMWHASENDEVSHALHKTVARVHKYAAGYDAVAVCVDRPPYKRAEILETYKAHREKTAAALLDQLRNVEERLDNDGFHILGAAGYEADDIIAKCAEVWAEGNQAEVTIYSADKDLLQLVTESVKVISTATGQEFTPVTVKEKLGIGPELVTDFLALIGDKSDNIPGIRGVGPKTAAKWLNQLGGLDAIMQEPESLPDKWQDVVRENKQRLGQAWKVVSLMYDAPIDPEVIVQKKGQKPTVEQEEIVFEQPAVAVVEAPADAAPAATRALAKANGQSWERMLEPTDSGGAWKLAQILYKSRMWGDFPNPEAILAVVLTGRSHGLDAVASLRGFHVIKGKVAPSAQMLIGLVKRHPECMFFRLVESTPEKATWETHRKGEPEPTRMTYTIEEAKQAGLVRQGSQYLVRPKTQLRWRGGTELARAVYPDITAGLYSIEEMEDV